MLHGKVHTMGIINTDRCGVASVVVIGLYGYMQKIVDVAYGRGKCKYNQEDKNCDIFAKLLLTTAEQALSILSKEQV